jgi:hypothetical protein
MQNVVYPKPATAIDAEKLGSGRAKYEFKKALQCQECGVRNEVTMENLVLNREGCDVFWFCGLCRRKVYVTGSDLEEARKQLIRIWEWTQISESKFGTFHIGMVEQDEVKPDTTGRLEELEKKIEQLIKKTQNESDRKTSTQNPFSNRAPSVLDRDRERITILTPKRDRNENSNEYHNPFGARSTPSPNPWFSSPSLQSSALSAPGLFPTEFPNGSVGLPPVFLTSFPRAIDGTQPEVDSEKRFTFSFGAPSN